MNKFSNKLFLQKDFNSALSKRELSCVLPYLNKTLLKLRARLRDTIKRFLPYCKFE